MSSAVRVIEVARRGLTPEVTVASGGSLTEAMAKVLDASPQPNPDRENRTWMTALWDELLTKGTARREGCDYSWEWLG